MPVTGVGLLQVSDTVLTCIQALPDKLLRVAKLSPECKDENVFRQIARELVKSFPLESCGKK